MFVKENQYRKNKKKKKKKETEHQKVFVVQVKWPHEWLYL